MMYSLKRWTIPKKAMAYIPWFYAAENEFGIPRNLLVRQAQQESDFNPLARNTSSGAVGMMQIVPRWHPDVDANDVYQSIMYAGKYLSDLHNQFGSWDKALAAYNWGPGNLMKCIRAYGDNWIDHTPRETQNYVYDITGDVKVKK